MAVISKATLEEEASPFFIANKKACELWNREIEKRGGEGDATVSAWALSLAGNVGSLAIAVKKATVSNGNLLIAPEQNVFVQTLLTIAVAEGYATSFAIRKKRWYDFLLNKPYKRLGYSKYYLFSNIPIAEVQAIIDLLDTYVKHGTLELVAFEASSKKLTIDIRKLVDSHHAVSKLLDFAMKGH